MIDCTPETPTENSGDSTLLPHRTCSDPANELFISVLSASPDGVEVVIRRAQPSSSAPVIDEVRTEIGRNRISFEAVARSDAAGVVDTDLLYFWKIGAKTTMITPETFVTGQRIEIERPEDNLPVWLLVSDQRGGETWRRVWPKTP